jgi:FMN reductase
MSARRIAVVSAGLSEPSSTRLLADQLAEAARADLARAGITAEVRVIELRALAHDIINNLLTGFPSQLLRQAIETVCGADGLIAVTPTFSASYSGLFKSFFDVLDNGALVGKQVLIAATGGTARHSLALEHAMRPMFVYLRAVIVLTAVSRPPTTGRGHRDTAPHPDPARRGRTRRPRGTARADPGGRSVRADGDLRGAARRRLTACGPARPSLSAPQRLSASARSRAASAIEAGVIGAGRPPELPR